MRLEPQILAAHGRTPAEIGSAAEPARPLPLLDPGAHRINAGGGTEIIGEHDVGGGKADGPAQLVAHLDTAFDLPAPAEERRRVTRPTRDQMLADLRR